MEAILQIVICLMDKKKELTNVNILKCFAIIGVIIIHVKSFNPNEYDPLKADNSVIFSVINYLINLGVPIFFSISGFLLVSSRTEKKISSPVFIRRIKRILIPLFFWAIFYYFFLSLLEVGRYGIIRPFYWRMVRNFDDVSYFLSTLGVGHLWYLVAYIYALFIIKVILNKGLLISLNLTMILFMCLYPFACKYMSPPFTHQFNFNPRPGFLQALVYMVGGMNIRYSSLSNRSLLLFLFAFLLLFLVMNYLVSIPFILLTINEILKFITVMFILICSLAIHTMKSNIVLHQIGKRSLGIYVIHIVFIKLSNVYLHNSSTLVWYMTIPIATLFMSYFAVSILEQIPIANKLVR